jgi:cytochrome c553
VKKLLIMLVAALFVLAACRKELSTSLDDLPEGDAVRGADVFRNGVGGAPSCATCHSTSDTTTTGPGLEGYGERAATRVDDENAEEYTFYSILHPSRYVVNGFSNVMYNNYEDRLSEQQIADLIAFLLTL